MVREQKEETLDPEDWKKMSALGHRMLDDMMAFLQNIRSHPFQYPTEEAINAILNPLNEEGEGEEKVYDIFLKNILPFTCLVVKPQFWGYVVGTGSPYGMLTQMLISGLNYSEEQFLSSKYVNQQAINWIKMMLDYPDDAGGIFVGSGSEANFTGLAVARNAKSEVDAKTRGIQCLDRRMTLYCSEETHHCLDRSVELLGLGNEALRWIPTDDECQIKLDTLYKAIKEDRQNNNRPFCVIGNAGTVNSGAFDDLNALADLCFKERLWFHVDGAFGAWVKLSKTHRHLADGLEKADSVAVDLHKWMNMPYTIGCTLVKDRGAHFSAFVYGHDAEYLKTLKEIDEDVIGNPTNLSLALSRPAYGMKAYMLLRAYGKEKYCRLVQQNIDQISYLADLIRREPNMEITVPVVSNIVCFRYIDERISESDLEKLNRLILGDMFQINFGMISDTTIKGKYMLRACNVNHRTQRKDFNWLIEEIKKSGEKHILQFI